MVIPYTLDVIIIALAALVIIECIKAPIKNVLIKKGLQDNKKVFKVITVTGTTIFCFAISCVYFITIQHVNPFSEGIIWVYTGGVITINQVLYHYLETYGRDGLCHLVKSLIAKHKEQTNIKELEQRKITAAQIVEGIQKLYSDAPVTNEDIESILDHIQ